MKRLFNFQSKLENGKITITADIDDYKFEQPVQQVTVGHFNPDNLNWPRHVQLSHEAFFIKAFGNGVGIMIDDLVDLATLVEPKTSFPPKLDKLDSSLKVSVCSEIEPSYQWQVSDNIDNRAKWTDIDGATTSELDRTKVKVGQFVRVIASSDAGSMTSNPAIVT